MNDITLIRTRSCFSSKLSFLFDYAHLDTLSTMYTKLLLTKNLVYDLGTNQVAFIRTIFGVWL